MHAQGSVGLVAIAVAVAGCGGGGGGSSQTLDCALLASDDNCWHQFLADVADCVPPDGEEGTLAADRTTCSYASGHRVEFHPEARSPWIDDSGESDTSYTLFDGETTCLDWSEGGTTMQIQSSTGTVSVSGSPSGSATITCPDRTRYTTSNYLGLLTECGYDTVTRGLPSQVLLENAAGFGVELTYMDEQDVRVFWCHP